MLPLRKVSDETKMAETKMVGKIQRILASVFILNVVEALCYVQI